MDKPSEDEIRWNLFKQFANSTFGSDADVDELIDKFRPRKDRKLERDVDQKITIGFEMIEVTTERQNEEKIQQLLEPYRNLINLQSEEISELKRIIDSKNKHIENLKKLHTPPRL